MGGIDLREPPHVTFVAFSGKDSGVVRELARSSFSLARTSPTALIDVLTDTDDMAAQITAAGLPPRAKVRQVQRDAVAHRFRAFGLRRFSHHSGLGGYSKLIVADLLQPAVNATIVVDTDTLFVSDVAPLWALRLRLARDGALLAAKRLSTGGACLRGQRINSGVVLMDLRRMRQTNFTSSLLSRVARLGRGGVPARECGKMVRNDTLAAGDQELLSFGCLHAGPAACLPLPALMHQDKCDGFSGGRAAVVLHFNCRGKIPLDCPTPDCNRLARDFESQAGRAPGRGLAAWRSKNAPVEVKHLPGVGTHGSRPH